MKLLINISLFVVALSQLCSASIDPTKDKRYPVINLLVTKVNEFTVNEFLEYGQLYSDLWPQFNETMASDEVELYNSKDYEEFSVALKEFFEALKTLKADKANCDFQKKATEKLDIVSKLEVEDKWREFKAYENRVQQLKNRSGELLAAKVFELYEQLPAAIESFVKSLDEADKEKYRELFNGCKMFLEETNEEQKYVTFTEIASSYKRGEYKIEGDDCKWDANAYGNFLWKLMIYVGYILKTDSETLE